MIYNFNENNRPKVILKSNKLIEEKNKEIFKNNILFEENKVSDREVEVNSFAYNMEGEILFICPIFVNKSANIIKEITRYDQYSTPLFPFMFEDSYHAILEPYIEINQQ